MELTVVKGRKEKRQWQVLIGLIERYLDEGKPVGSKTLQEELFPQLSASTIRNYLAELETAGYLEQQHTSGGRFPTPQALSLYAKEVAENTGPSTDERFDSIRHKETREVVRLLQSSAEQLSRETKQAIFLSSPRFDHDFIIKIKLIPIDAGRFVSLILTDFGVIRTEMIHTQQRLTPDALKRIENEFHSRLSGNDNPDSLTQDERKLAQTLYRELMVRHVVSYSTFIEEEIYRTGFSQLLSNREFRNPELLASTLALFENGKSMRLLLKECLAKNQLCYWIGEDLAPFTASTPACTVIAAPYKLHSKQVGTVGLLGPTRLPYRHLFALLQSFCEALSEALTRNLYKFKIEFREPQLGACYLPMEEKQHILLVDKRSERQ